MTDLINFLQYRNAKLEQQLEKLFERANSPGNRGLIPLNAITPAIGAPVILYVLLRRPKH